MDYNTPATSCHAKLKPAGPVIRPLGVAPIERPATAARNHDRLDSAGVSDGGRRSSFRRYAALAFSMLRRLFPGQSHPKPLHLLARAEAKRSREARKARSHARQALRKRGNGDAA